MKVIGILSWYQEPPAMLAATVASFGRVITDLVAVDGPYAAYEHGGRPRSAADQVDTIQRTCDALGIGLTLHQPRDAFFGNEVEKRSLAFSLASSIADEDDWLWVFDGDEVLLHEPPDLISRLHCIERDAIEVTLSDRRGMDDGTVEQVLELPPESRSTLRMLFRALPGMRCEGRHDHYIAGAADDPIVMWAPTHTPGLIPAFSMPEVVVDHRQRQRPQHRQKAARDYYAMRDALGIEHIPVNTIRQVAEKALV